MLLWMCGNYYWYHVQCCSWISSETCWFTEGEADGFFKWNNNANLLCSSSQALSVSWRKFPNFWWLKVNNISAYLPLAVINLLLNGRSQRKAWKSYSFFVKGLGMTRWIVWFIILLWGGEIRLRQKYPLFNFMADTHVWMYLHCWKTYRWCIRWKIN